MKIILPTAFAIVLFASPLAAADQSITCPKGWGEVRYHDTANALIISCAKPKRLKRTKSSKVLPAVGGSTRR